MSDGRQATTAAAVRAALQAFGRLTMSFAEVTRRAPGRFAARDWRGMHEDAVERLGIYGGVLDALLTGEDEVSIVFSFARSYFHVEAERPHELVAFLRSIMPRKPIAELYTSIGHHKHGKTELYRALLRRLESSEDRFETAPGEPGLVMLVFTLPSWDVVFKIIRDDAGPPKRTTRRNVLERYRLVFTLDRVGRLVDAQEFEHLTFERRRFAPELLAELLRHAPGSVAIGGDLVEIKHLFTERRLRR